ncbi:MAG: hypothetical protein KY391_02240 [Actinobacteria bacterium]|nr:hypothetical protein [Actinomycetota bacterium]
MRTLAVGISRFRAAPYALLPMTIEGVVAGMLIALGVIPASGASVAAGAMFPLDVFFDVKQALAQTSSWVVFVMFLVLSIVVRSAVLAATIVAADRNPGTFVSTWIRAARLVFMGAAALLPSAAVMFSGTASRYAPFLWVGAVLGFFPALWLARRGVSLPSSEGQAGTTSVPEGSSFLAYAYFSALLGAAMSSFGDSGRLASAAIVIFAAPIHGLLFLGWRDHSRNATYPGGGTMAVAVTAIAIAIVFGGTIYDRFVRDFPPVGETSAPGTLLMLGGVDTTSTTGPLTEIDVRRFGYPDRRARLLSYRGVGETTRRSDTRGDLSEVAEAVGEQVGRAEEPVALLGHSQAALILDRMIDEGLDAPQRAAVLAPPPPFPPSLRIPAPGVTAPGKPGGDVARAFAAVLRSIGLETYDVDTPAFPTNLEPVVLIDADIQRLSVWALGDSVWLDRDWRRPGEANVVALTDHVGVVNNGRAVAATKTFFEGRRPDTDEASWRGAFVSLLRHAFAPWRPAEV